MIEKRKEKYRILLVDDSEDDRLFMRRAFRQNARFIVVGEVADGEDAMAYLSGQGEFSNRKKHPLPDVVLLDIKMPRKTGFDVLTWLHSQPFEDLHVYVVSGSFLPQDIERSLALGADGYHQKSARKEQLEAMIRDIEKALDNDQSFSK